MLNAKNNISFVNKYKCKYNYKAVFKQLFKMIKDKNLKTNTNTKPIKNLNHPEEIWGLQLDVKKDTKITISPFVSWGVGGFKPGVGVGEGV